MNPVSRAFVLLGVVAVSVLAGAAGTLFHDGHGAQDRAHGPSVTGWSPLMLRAREHQRTAFVKRMKGGSVLSPDALDALRRQISSHFGSGDVPGAGHEITAIRERFGEIPQWQRYVLDADYHYGMKTTRLADA